MSGTTSGKPPGSSTAPSRPVRCCNICKRERDLENWFYKTGRYSIWGQPLYDGRCKECKARNKTYRPEPAGKPAHGFEPGSIWELFFSKIPPQN